MKRLLIILLSMILCTNLALAAASFSVDKDYLNFEEIDWGEDDSETIKITNDGTELLTNIDLSSNAHSNYNLKFNKDLFNLSTGQSETITVEVTLKDDPKASIGNKTIGDIDIKSDQYTLSNDIPMYVTAPARFHISDLDVKVGSESETNLDNDTKIEKKAKPGDTVLFTVELENLFDNDDDEYEIEDVEIEIEIKDIDDKDDIKEDTDRFSISAGSKERKTLEFEIPNKVIDDFYDVTIKAKGDNKETNEKYTIEWELKINVEKKSHDIVIKEVSLSPEKLICNNLIANLDVELINQGNKEEDKVVLEIKNSDLNINERFTNIKLGKDYDKDATYKKDMQLNIDEELAVKGKYFLEVNVYFDTSKLDDQKVIELEVEGCEEDIIEEEPEEEPVVIEAPKVEEPVEEEIIEEPKTNTSPKPIIEIKDNEKPSLFIPIAGLVLLSIIIGILLVIIILRKE